jgi:hypothetical protein
MDLIGRENTVITLSPIRYAHPEWLYLDGYDSVRVFGRVTEQTDSWSFEGESLLTSELQELSAWLHGVIDGSVLTSAEWNGEHAALMRTEKTSSTRNKATTSKCSFPASGSPKMT